MDARVGEWRQWYSWVMLPRRRREEVGEVKCRVEVHTRSADSGVQWKDGVKKAGRGDGNLLAGAASITAFGEL